MAPVPLWCQQRWEQAPSPQPHGGRSPWALAMAFLGEIWPGPRGGVEANSKRMRSPAGGCSLLSNFSPGGGDCGGAGTPVLETVPWGTAWLLLPHWPGELQEWFSVPRGRGTCAGAFPGWDV